MESGLDKLKNVKTEMQFMQLYIYKAQSSCESQDGSTVFYMMKSKFDPR